MKAVHVGFPKTATTFLQTAVFPGLVSPGFVYVPQEASIRLFASLIDDDDTIYNPAMMAERLLETVGASEAVLFSYEGLTGHHYRSGFMNRSQIARRLKQAGFDRVLITIRNQFDALESAYKQYIKGGGVLRFREYITFDESRTRYLDPRYFDYHLIYDLYGSTFGPSNVLVLQYERLREPEFLETLSRFLCARASDIEWGDSFNRSLSFEKMALLRICNHFTYSSLHPSTLISKRVSTSAVHRLMSRLPFGNSDRSFHDEGTRASVARFYADSNRRLAEAARVALTSSYPGFDGGES
ncbi:MAG: hypothetical protein ABL963_07455 [Longimicrobiales bacterium]